MRREPGLQDATVRVKSHMTLESLAVIFVKGKSEAMGMGLRRLREGHNKIKEQRCVSLQSLTWDSMTRNRKESE